MSAQPYSDVEIRAIQCAHDEGIPASVNLAWVRTAEPRWLATVDALTSRLDAATRERDELRAKLAGAEKERGVVEVGDGLLMGKHSVEAVIAERVAASRRADEVERAMGAARLLLFAAHPSSELPERYIVSKHDIDTLRAALARIDAAKEGRHA